MEKENRRTSISRAGGRPRKKIRREKHIMVRLTVAEHFIIAGKSEKAGMRISEWFRRAAAGARVVQNTTPDDLKNLRVLAGMANNLNQLTKLAHQQGIFTLAKSCRKMIGQIDGILKMIWGK